MTPDKVTNVFTLKQLFEMPIKAVIDANEYAARTAVDFIRKYGFTGKKGDDDWGELKMIRFSYEYLQNGVSKKMVVEIPLISMIPLPLLEVKRANFDFAIRIIDQVIIGKDGHLDSKAPALPSTSVLALLVPERKSQLEERLERNLVSNMDVRVEVERSDIPAGLLELMNLAQSATSGEESKEVIIETDKDYLSFSASDPNQTLSVRVRFKDKGPVRDVLVTVHAVGSTGSAMDHFEENVSVANGRVVGFPNLPKLTVLCSGEKGFELTFHATGILGNGFFKISHGTSFEHLVYYEIVP